MSRFEFDRDLKRRVEQAERRRRKESTPAPRPIHRAIVETWRELRAAVAAARRAGARLVVRTVVEPADSWPPAPTTAEPARSERRAIEAASAATRAQNTAPPANDPYPYMRQWTTAQLHARGRQAMPHAERIALERELHERELASRRAPPPPDPVELERRLRAEYEAGGGRDPWSVN